MVDHALLHRMLDIPEEVDSPTHYQLLGVNPLRITPELVNDALRQRIAQLRRQVPGPQLLPMIAQFEKLLEEAAETLRDPEKREAYQNTLKGHARDRKRKLTDEQRAFLRRVRRIVQKALNEDGTLNAAKHPDLIDTLQRMKVPEKDIRYILAQIPKRGETAG